MKTQPNSPQDDMPGWSIPAGEATDAGRLARTALRERVREQTLATITRPIAAPKTGWRWAAACAACYLVGVLTWPAYSWASRSVPLETLDTEVAAVDGSRTNTTSQQLAIKGNSTKSSAAEIGAAKSSTSNNAAVSQPGEATGSSIASPDSPPDSPPATSAQETPSEDELLSAELVLTDSPYVRYVRIGDRYMRDSDTWQQAARTYGIAMKYANEQERQLAADDNWMLISIKRDHLNRERADAIRNLR